MPYLSEVLPLRRAANRFQYEKNHPDVPLQSFPNHYKTANLNDEKQHPMQFEDHNLIYNRLL